MRFGVNLFGPGMLLRKDPEKFFADLKKDGYRYAEPCIFIGERPDALTQFWKMEECERFFSTLQKSGLLVKSCHVYLAEEEGAAAQLLYLASRYGVEDFVVSTPDESSLQSYEKFAARCCELSDALSRSGCRLVLHNHADSIRFRLEGKTAFEWLLEKCEGRLKAEPDVGHIFRGGEDPVALLGRIQPYIASLHYKDFCREDEMNYSERPLGNGQVEIGTCFQIGRYSEVIQYVDQDESEDFSGDLERAIGLLNQMTQLRDGTRSVLYVYDTVSDTITRIHTFDRVAEAPNWLGDGDTLIYNSEGKIWKYRISSDQEERIDTDFCDNCNNDHVVSSDDRYLAVSHMERDLSASNIFIFPIEGGKARPVTSGGANFLHGWSPDLSQLAYCGIQIDENGQWTADIYTIQADGTDIRQLTRNAGYNDGSEYTPDGKEILFISSRTGLMQVYRMGTDGTNQRQLTFEEQNNWFGHISPDGRRIVNLAYSKDGLDANEHLPNMRVSLWMMNQDGSDRRKLIDFFGGQGSINVNSWAPDSSKFAFFMYEWTDSRVHLN